MPDSSNGTLAAASSSSNDVPPDIEALKLADYVQEAALRLRAQHPAVRFTSGRRDMPAQAHAMAGNVVKNRNWIAETYADTPQRAALQGWVNAHPQAKSREAIAAGLRKIMAGWTAVQLGRFSRHLSGEAFDVQPVDGPQGEAIKETIRALPNLDRFIDREGGLTVWHAQFSLS